ncbi:MAG: RAD55 family ATPase, partial [Candidatus Lutacidiplasmatales archaeon]
MGPGRVSTGVAALDEILYGGLVPSRPYLIVGPSGTGKTTLALQFLCEGVRRGENCLLVTLEEPPNEMKTNHASLGPELDEVFVFDAIPDVMRYERAPFKDIATVRASTKFKDVGSEIRKTPELSSVEVTFTALEQTLKLEIARRHYKRLVIDSLTALQYFCMKGVDESLGAQSFLRFLSDLRITTVLTVESPLEDIETPERLLARGEVRLFRWELDGKTVRALGVEKLRGSPHDARLHPYRISGRGIDIQLDVTISRDTRELLLRGAETVPAPVLAPEPQLADLADGLSSLEQDLKDLATLGISFDPVRASVLRAVEDLKHGSLREASQAMRSARVEAVQAFTTHLKRDSDEAPGSTRRAAAAERLATRSADLRGGLPPTSAAGSPSVTAGLERVLALLTHPPSVASPAPPE